MHYPKTEKRSREGRVWKGGGILRTSLDPCPATIVFIDTWLLGGEGCRPIREELYKFWGDRGYAESVLLPWKRTDEGLEVTRDIPGVFARAENADGIPF